MRVQTLHRWDVTPQEAIRIQQRLASSVREDPFDMSSARYIAGLDVSSEKDNPILTAGIVVWDRVTEEIVEAVHAQAASSFPYIPGFLSFREVPVLSEAIEKLRTTPDVFMVDGQGRAHPRRLGIAAHIGLLIDHPTVGVAKSRLCGTETPLGPAAGDASPLLDGTVEIGRLVRTKNKTNPVYVSVGNRMTLDAAVELTLTCCKGFRLPEPTRLAHLHVNAVRTAGRGLVADEAEQMQLL